MDDIYAFVMARISEDEAVVRGVSANLEPHRDLWVNDWARGQLGLSPGRMRVELEAKRRLLTLARVNGDEQILRVLAMVYDDHADWHPDWRVLGLPEDDHALTQQFD